MEALTTKFLQDSQRLSDTPGPWELRHGHCACGAESHSKSSVASPVGDFMGFNDGLMVI